MGSLRTSVAIIGAGPAGLLLSELLHRRGVSSIVLEKYSRSHLLSRIRAGVLEQTTVDVFRANGLSERMDREGQPHDGAKIVWAGREGFFIDTARHVGRRCLTYGQAKIQEDLFQAADRRNATVLTGVDRVVLEHVTSEHPTVSFLLEGKCRCSNATSSPAAMDPMAFLAYQYRRPSGVSSQKIARSGGWA